MVKEKASGDFKKYKEINENTTYQNLWDATKTVHRGKFIALTAYCRKEERSQNNNLSFHFQIQKKFKQNISYYAKFLNKILANHN